MDNQLLEPVKFYEQSGKRIHTENVTAFYDELVKKSGVNVEENRKTVSEYKKQMKKVEELSGKITGLKVLRGFMIFFAVVAFIVALCGILVVNGTLAKTLCITLGILVGVGLILLVTLLLNKAIKRASDLRAKEQEKADALLKKAWEQMAPLNALFTERDTFSLIEKTLPQLKFHYNYDLTLAREMAEKYDFIDVVGQNCSVIDTVAGRYNDNPFVFYRYIKHTMGTKTYFGSLVIHWVTYERDSQGRMRTRHHSQTLTASVIKPYPLYNTLTALAYGHQSAEKLTFTRDFEHVEQDSEKSVEKRIKKGEKKLQKKAMEATEKGGTFTEMANSEFDVLFDATDRNDEVQFRMLFSPLAQINMVKLLRSQVGYGDDFNFIKNRRCNIIQSEHALSWDMDTDARKFHSYDIDASKEFFINFNDKYFKSVFFDFAPLLSCPTYHDKPLSVFEPIKRAGAQYTEYEREALANSIGRRNFAHEATATEVILKTDYMRSSKSTDGVRVSAHSYAGESRVDFIPVLGGDGKIHPVPVPWIEYIPVSKVTQMAMREFNVTEKEFKGKTSGKLGGLSVSPWAYNHGLYAKIMAESESVDNIENAFGSI